MKNFKKVKTDDERLMPVNAQIFIDNVMSGVAIDHGDDSLTRIYPHGEDGYRFIVAANKELSPTASDDEAIKDWSKRHGALKAYLKTLFEDYRTRNVRRFLAGKIKENLDKLIVLQRSVTTLRSISLSHPVPYYLKNEERKEELVAILAEKVLPKLLPGEVLGNSNIPKSILKKAGFRDEQIESGQQDKLKTKSTRPKL